MYKTEMLWTHNYEGLDSRKITLDKEPLIHQCLVCKISPAKSVAD